MSATLYSILQNALEHKAKKPGKLQRIKFLVDNYNLTLASAKAIDELMTADGGDRSLT